MRQKRIGKCLRNAVSASCLGGHPKCTTRDAEIPFSFSSLVRDLNLEVGLDRRRIYLYANPMNGLCAVPANHISGSPCVSQSPPNTNPDDTLPGFTLSTFYQAFLGYSKNGFNGALGNILFESPWANPADSRLKPAAFALIK